MDEIVNFNVDDVLVIDGIQFTIFNCQDGYGLSSFKGEWFYGDVFETLGELKDMINSRIDEKYLESFKHYSVDDYDIQIEIKAIEKVS